VRFEPDLVQITFNLLQIEGDLLGIKPDLDEIEPDLVQIRSDLKESPGRRITERGGSSIFYLSGPRTASVRSSGAAEEVSGAAPAWNRRALRQGVRLAAPPRWTVLSSGRWRLEPALKRERKRSACSLQDDALSFYHGVSPANVDPLERPAALAGRWWRTGRPPVPLGARGLPICRCAL
jgi:hypothetical protein